MAGPEAKVEQAVMRWCKSHGITALKMTPTGHTGWPDRVIILSGGQVLWLEFKAPNASLSPKQAWVHSQLKLLGHRAEVCYDAEETCKIIEEALFRAFERVQAAATKKMQVG